jgi:hypothetical protein
MFNEIKVKLKDPNSGEVHHLTFDRDKKIQAIKDLRNLTHQGLKESKNGIDQLWLLETQQQLELWEKYWSQYVKPMPYHFYTEPILLWEILVPCHKNDGTPHRTRFHREWDRRVQQVSNGITILPPAKGKWYNDAGVNFTDRVIPVRIACRRLDIMKIIDITLKHYDDQEAVMAYRIADEVIIKNRPQ